MHGRDKPGWPGPRPLPRLCLLVALTTRALAGQNTPPPAEPVQTDPVLADLARWEGRALILRATPAGSDLQFDPAGHLAGIPKTLDWTLAGMDLDHVTQRRPGDPILLEGVRVAIRYNPGAHLFERHPQKTERLRLSIPEPTTPAAAEALMHRLFAIGIDPELQRAMPPYWLHYFQPATPWPPAGPDGAALGPVIPTTAALPPGVSAPSLDRNPEPGFTAEGRLDRVRGNVQLGFVVAPDGTPHRIAIRQPLGYGLDADAAANTARLRFHPGSRDGAPVAVEMILNQNFDLSGPQPPPTR